MGDEEFLLERFEAQRPHLRAVAYRMLGSLSDADDALQEAWLRVGRADASSVENVGGWLTTIVAREPDDDPERDALLADAVGLALLVVLDTLSPAERLAFVLHDMFAVPFDDIATILERSPAAARQLASRARRRVPGAPPAPPPG